MVINESSTAQALNDTASPRRQVNGNNEDTPSSTKRHPHFFMLIKRNNNPSRQRFHLPLVLPQTLPHALPTPSPIVLVLALLLLAQHPRRLDIRRALFVRTVEQADYAQEDRLGGLDGAPALRGRLVAVLVLLGGVQDGNAQLAVFVNVGMERDGILECERGRHVRVVFRENEPSAKVASYIYTNVQKSAFPRILKTLGPTEKGGGERQRESTHRRSICSRR